MRRLTLPLFLAVLAFVLAAEPRTVAAAAGKIERFGAPITAEPHQSLAAVLAEPEAHAGKTVLVEGQVRRACTLKGCWMEIAAAADPAAPGCRVTFKDYGFFVPTDSAGSRVLVQGTVEVKTVTAGDVAHLEGEGATFAAKRPDGSAREVHLVATGVELQRP
jgi:hypothetical protein